MATELSNPYVGPRPFQRGETLYGRDGEARDLQHLVVAERIVMLYSPSGAGKTSLLQAALIPRLEKKRFHVWPVIRMNRELPREYSLPAGVSRYVVSLLLSLEEAFPLEQRMPLDQLVQTPIDEWLRTRTPNRPDGTPPERSILIIDQFEEVLTLDPVDFQHKTDFFLQIGEALRERDRFAIFTLREDYVGSLDPYLRPLPTRLSTRFRLGLLGHDAAVEAMQLPAKPDVEFMDAAARMLAEDLSKVRVQQHDGTAERQGMFVEPVQLQVVCRRLWDRERADPRRIDVEDVKSVGDVDKALGDYYADQVQRVARNTGATERAIRDWCSKVLITQAGVRGQVLHTQGSSNGLGNHAIGGLVNSHLVRAEERRGAIWYELSHDRLIEPIRRSNTEWVSKQDVLVRAARRWSDNQSDPSYLFTGEQLNKAIAEASRTQPDPLAERFLEACKAAEEERQQKGNMEKALERQYAWSVRFACAAVCILFSAVVTIIEPGSNAMEEFLGLVVISAGVACVAGWLYPAWARRQKRAEEWVRKLTHKHRLLRNSPEGATLVRAAPAPAVHANYGPFEPWELRTLQFTVLWAFLVVAGRDDRFSYVEINALRRGVKRAKARAGERFRAVYEVKPDVLLAEFLADPRDTRKGLQDAGDLLAHRATEQEASEFTAAVLDIMHSVATPGLFGHWRKPSSDEQQVLSTIALALGSSTRAAAAGS